MHGLGMMNPRIVQPGLWLARSAAALLLLGYPTWGEAQVCQLPESVRAQIPDAAPAEDSALLGEEVPFEQIPLGIGHAHYVAEGAAFDLPPGGDDWLRRVELPLSHTPGAQPWGWIVQGWILTMGDTAEPFTTAGLIETGYEEPSFVVLESRSDGWLRIRFESPEKDVDTSWTPSCALRTSPARLDFTPWSDWFLSDRVTPMFFRSDPPHLLQSGPSTDAERLVEVSDDYILEPLEIQGEWMRVTLKEPSDYCVFDVEPTRREGWIRWYSPDTGPRVWYFTRGC